MSDSFVRTDTILDEILAHKAQEVAHAKTQISPQSVMALAHDSAPPRDLLAALQRQTVALIAEVKRASPSKGILIENFNPLTLGEIYAQNGAAAISVLTDGRFFQGTLDDLRMVRATVAIPVLRKDFTIDAYQVYEGRAAGADAMLLIVAALSDAQLQDLFGLITELGMAALVEVHNVSELERALALGAHLIGVNNRDLKTFAVDLNTTAQLAKLVPKNVTLVAESGLKSDADVAQMGQLGARAVLIGEGLVRADDIAAQVRAFSSQPL